MIILLGKEHDLIIHHCEKFELEERKDANDILNPHYTEVRIATDHNHVHEGNTVANEKSERSDSGSSKTEYDGSNLINQQRSPPHSEAEEMAQINNSHSDQIKNQESHIIHTEIDVSSEYAVVDKSKKNFKATEQQQSSHKSNGEFSI